MDYSILLKNLPVIFAVLGLALVLIAIFLKGKDRLFFNLFGFLFIVFFIYKLFLLQTQPQVIEGVGGLTKNTDTFFSVIFIGICLNILAFFLWFYAILKVSFNKEFNMTSQRNKLILGLFIIIISLLIAKFFGIFIAAIFFPVLATGYFIAVKNSFLNIKTVDI
ncbi:MAG TPA: hypothetical protein VFU62_04415 [Hanamia sp.]|nr:hypothetical protein [Hanamia sp.]